MKVDRFLQGLTVCLLPFTQHPPGPAPALLPPEACLDQVFLSLTLFSVSSFQATSEEPTTSSPLDRVCLA